MSVCAVVLYDESLGAYLVGIADCPENAERIIAHDMEKSYCPRSKYAVVDMPINHRNWWSIENAVAWERAEKP